VTLARAVLLGLGVALLLGLGGCGRRNSPVPPGPADQVTYPRTYPAY
jgi:hypothetical protein